MTAKSPARIALLTTITSEEPEWAFLKEASRRFPDILFVVPAGDAKRTFDASISLDNVIVVTAAASRSRQLTRVPMLWILRFCRRRQARRMMGRGTNQHASPRSLLALSQLSLT